MREPFSLARASIAFCFGDGGGEGLLAQYILTRLHGGLRHGEVEFVGSTDMDGVEFRISEQILELPVARSMLIASANLRAARQCVQQRRPPLRCEAAQCFGVHPAHETNSKDGGLQLFHIYEGRARPRGGVRTKASFPMNSWGT